MTITQRTTHEKSSAWETGYQWHVRTFVDGQLRRESFTGAKRRAAQREGAKIAYDQLQELVKDLREAGEIVDPREPTKMIFDRDMMGMPILRVVPA